MTFGNQNREESVGLSCLTDAIADNTTTAVLRNPPAIGMAEEIAVDSSILDSSMPAASGSKPARQMSSVSAVVQSVAAKVLIIGINALTGIITARALRPEGRGELAAMILWPVFLAFALSMGIPSALTFQLRRNPEKQSQLMGAGLLLGLLSGAMAALVGMLFMHGVDPPVPAAGDFVRAHIPVQCATLFSAGGGTSGARKSR